MITLLRNLSVLTVVVFLFFSCAEFEAKREVLSYNRFYTTSPNFELKIDDGFAYKGKFDKIGKAKGITTPSTGADSFFSTSNAKFEYYLWSKESTNILVLFKTPLDGWKWFGNASIGKNSTIHIKNEKLAGKVWKTGFKTVRFNNFPRDKFNVAGNDIAGNSLSKLWVRKASAHTIIHIYYWENVDNHINTRTIVIRGKTRDKEMRFIKEFNKRADSAFTFIK